jgi:hypothetical protein
MTLRLDILNTAAELTGGPRAATYGDPWSNMDAFARLVQAYFGAKYNADFEVSAEDAAWLMVLAKMARTTTGKGYHQDNYVDAAAYAAIAGECAEVENFDDNESDFAEENEVADMIKLAPAARDAAAAVDALAERIFSFKTDDQA